MASPAIQAFIDNGLFDRLPLSFSTFCFDQMKDWDLLFPAERSYFERLFSLLDRLRPAEFDKLFEPMRAAELKMGVNEKNWPKRQFSLDQVDLLNRSPYYSEWRASVSQVFAAIDPVLDAEVGRKGRPRLVIVVSPSELPTEPDRMWLRIAARGKRLSIKPPADAAQFLPLLVGGLAAAPGPYESWVIEAGDSLSKLAANPGVVKYSYQALEPYRKRLMTEVNHMVTAEEIRGPRQLSARLKQMKVLSSEGDLARDPILAEFARAALLSGNGTLLINNTFVEWASVQAIRRAKPPVMMIGFGVRNKVKPFSSLMIYADQEDANPIPTQMDTLGTYVDLEVLYQYIWQEFEKYAEYRRNTVYLFAADGMDQMLVIGPSDFQLPAATAPLDLSQVNRACRNWLGL